MIALDENALICDFAETYHIYDYRKLPVKMAAIFASGLKKDSRIYMKKNDMQYTTDTMLLASMADSMAFLAWSKTEAAKENTGRPKSILQQMLKKEEKQNDVMIFANGEEFKKARKELLKGGA